MEQDTDEPTQAPVKPDAIEGPVTTLTVASPLGSPKPPPTLEEVLAGRSSLDTPNAREALKAAVSATVVKERKRVQAQVKAKQREAYEQGRKDALARVGNIEDAWVQVAERIALKLLSGEELTKQELKLLPTMHKTIEAVKDRALGKPTSRIEADHTHSVLHAMVEMNAGWDDPKGT